MAYLALETDPELEFEHMLAAELGRTVAELRASLANDEYVRWSVYYARKAQQAELERAREGQR